jgi:type IV secretory pathway VirB4 component
MARAKPMISILERGDSYRPLVELMGGRCIDIDLEGRVTLNPWDLAPGTTTPGKDKVAFLKNLTRHMIGDSPHSDTALLDNLLSEAIGRTYKRCAIRSPPSTICGRSCSSGGMRIGWSESSRRRNSRL